MEPQNNPQVVQSVPVKQGTSTFVKVLMGCGCCSILAVIIVVAISGAGIFGLSKVAEEVQKESEKVQKTNDNNFENPKSINTPVKVSDLEWTLTEAKIIGKEIKADNEFSKNCVASSGSQFIYIKFKLKNLGDKLATTDGLNVYDEKKREFTSYSEIYKCMSETKSIFIIENINPGLEKEYEAFFEVPEDAKNFRVKVGDLDLFKDEFDYIKLGF